VSILTFRVWQFFYRLFKFILDRMVQISLGVIIPALFLVAGAAVLVYGYIKM